MILGNFSLNDDRNSEFRIGDHINKYILKNNENRKRPLYIAEMGNTISSISEYKTFEINSKLKA